jgi:hypothetical protein
MVYGPPTGIDVRFDQLAVLDAVVEDHRDFGLAIDIALIDPRRDWFLEFHGTRGTTELGF